MLKYACLSLISHSFYLLFPVYSIINTFDFYIPVNFTFMVSAPFIFMMYFNFVDYCKIKDGKPLLRRFIVVQAMQFVLLLLLVNIFVLWCNIYSMIFNHVDTIRFLFLYCIFVMIVNRVYYISVKSSSILSQRAGKRILIATIYLILVPLCFYAKIETLTLIHGKEFNSLKLNDDVSYNNMGKLQQIKVFEYDADKAKLYVEDKNSGAFIFIKKVKNHNWMIYNDEYLWDNDSATKSPWPPY